MLAQPNTIPNTGADRLRTAVLRRAAVFVAAVAASSVAAVMLAGEPIYVREIAFAPPALISVLAAGYLFRANGKDKVIGNLSLDAGRAFITAFHHNARKLPPDEAAKVSDKWFHLKTF